MPTRKLKKRAAGVPSTRTTPDVLDVQMTAEFLTVSADTVYDLFKRGELPGRKVGRKWRTTRHAVLRWIERSSADDTSMHALLPCAILVSPSVPQDQQHVRDSVRVLHTAVWDVPLRRCALDHPPGSVPTPRRTTLVAFLALLIAVLVINGLMVLPYVLAVTMGGILAVLAQPVWQWLTGHHIPPRVAAAVVVLGVVLVIIAPLAVFVTKAIQQGIAIGHSLADGGVSVRSLLDHVSGWAPIETLIGSPDAFETQARRWMQSAGTTATATILGLAAHLPNLVLQVALASIACFFLLVDGPRLRGWMTDKLPIAADVRVHVGQSFQETAISVIWATIAAAAAQSAVMLLSYLTLGVPAAFLAAGATFLFAWIPLVGSTPVWLAGAIYLYTQDALLKALLMVVCGLMTGLVDNFVRPLILQGRSKMHPLVSLVAIFGGIEMFGILGIFLGPILAAVLIALLQIWPEVGQRFGLLPGAPGGECRPRSERSAS